MTEGKTVKRDYLMAFSDFGRQLPSSPHQHPYFPIDGATRRRAGPAQTIAEYQGETRYVSEPDRMGIKIWSGPEIATDLSDIVGAIADNDLTWFVFDLEGTGTSFASQKWKDNEDALGPHGEGLALRWMHLKNLASGVQSTETALIVAGRSQEELAMNEIRNGIYGSADFAIERFDNTYWVLACKLRWVSFVDFNALLHGHSEAAKGAQAGT